MFDSRNSKTNGKINVLCGLSIIFGIAILMFSLFFYENYLIPWQEAYNTMSVQFPDHPNTIIAQEKVRLYYIITFGSLIFSLGLVGIPVYHYRSNIAHFFSPTISATHQRYKATTNRSYYVDRSNPSYLNAKKYTLSLSARCEKCGSKLESDQIFCHNCGVANHG